MRVPLPIVCAIALGCACASVQRQPRWTPLDSEGEVHVQLLPLPSGADRLRVEIAGISALRSDGAELPLELMVPLLHPSAVSTRMVFAQGRLEPGTYVGLLVKVRRATLDQSAGVADLLVPDQPARIEVPFTVTPRHAILVTLDFQAEASVDQRIAFTPVFAGQVTRRPVPEVMGLATNFERHSLIVFDKRTLTVTAIWPTEASPWGVVLDERSKRAWVSLSSRDEIQVFDLVSGTEVSRIRLSAGDAPRELALAGDGATLLVVNHGSSTLSFIDKGTMVETGRLNVGEAPTSILLDRPGTTAFVFGSRNQISVIDLRTRTLLTHLSTEDRPLRGQLDRSGRRLYVASATSPNLTVYGIPGFTVERRIHIGLGTTFLHLDPNTDLLYVANRDDGVISIYDPSSLIPIDSLCVSGAVAWMAVADAENALFALQPERRRISVFNLTSRRLLDELPVDEGARIVTVAGERR